MKSYILTLMILASTGSFAQTITQNDLELIRGNWTGSLTYLDYQTKKPFSMPADLIVTRGNNGSQLVLNNIYPNEPKANGTSKIRISKDHTEINKAKIVSREELAGGSIQIKTESEGKDDNKKATIRLTYTFSNTKFIITKEVQFESGKEWIKRNEFNYTRK